MWAIEETIADADQPSTALWSAPKLTRKEAEETAQLWRKWSILCRVVRITAVDATTGLMEPFKTGDKR